MNNAQLEARINLIKDEIAKMEKSIAIFHGHLGESQYWLKTILDKEEADKKAEEAAKKAEEDKTTEESEDGEANIETTECAA